MKWIYVTLLLPAVLLAQNKPLWDTTRYQKFNSNLIIGVYQSYRNFSNEFNPVSSRDSTRFATNYMAESSLSTGLEFNYDKIGFSIGLRSKPQENSQGKGQSRTINFNFNLGGNRWFLETSYRNFKGFYDVNTARYDPTFRTTGQYAQEQGFSNQLFRSKFMYFTNHHRYAFRSNYVCNYRQLKTGGSWILSANTNFNDLRNDSSLFPKAARKFYDYQSNLRGLSVAGISANAGAAVTIVVWRALFFHMMFIAGPEQQWRTYHYLNAPNKTISYLSISGDIRLSLGFNWRRAYMVWTSMNDFVLYNNSVMTLQNKSLGGSFMWGWRFKSKTPEFYKKFQKTNLYSNL